MKKVIKIFFLLNLFIAPLNSGMFFEDQFWLAAISSVVLLFYVLKTQGWGRLGFPGLLLLLLSCSYFLSFWGAAAPYFAYVGFLKYVFYFVMYLLTVRLWGETEEEKKIILWTMASAITVSTVTAFLGYANFLVLPNVFFMGRFTATLQYPNAYAIMLVVVIILSIYLYIVGTKKWSKTLLLIMWFLNTTAFYGTLSRGVFLVYFPALLCLFLFLKKRDRPLVGSNLILINGLALVCINYIFKNPNPQTIIALVLGVVAILSLNLAVEKKMVPLSYLAGVLLVLFLVGGVYTLQHFPEKAALQKLTRLTEMGLQVKSVETRLYYYQDALKLLPGNWLLGTGARGWEVLYRTVQGHLYSSTEVHSSVLQTLVESGLLGTALFLGLFAYVFVQQLRRGKKQKNTLLARVVFLAVAVIFLHSLIDLELTFVSIAMYLSVLLGLLGSEHKINLAQHQILRFVSLVLVVVLFLSSASMGLAHLYARKPLASIKTHNPFRVIPVPSYERNLLIAQKLSPLNPLYSSYLGLIKIAQGLWQKTPDEIEQGLQFLEEAIILSPFQYETYLTKGSVLAQLQRKDEAIPYFEKLITLMPMQNSGYQYGLENYLLLACETGDKGYLDAARDLYASTVEQMQKVKPERLLYWEEEELDKALFTNLKIATVECLAGDFLQGKEYIDLVVRRATGPIREELRAWLVVTQENRDITPTLTADPFELEQARNLLQDFRVKAQEREQHF